MAVSLEHHDCHESRLCTNIVVSYRRFQANLFAAEERELIRMRAQPHGILTKDSLIDTDKG